MVACYGNPDISSRQGKARTPSVEPGRSFLRKGVYTESCTGSLSYIPGIIIHFVNTSTTGVLSMTEVTAAPLPWKTINIDACILHAVTAPFTQYQESIRFSLLSSASL